VPNIIASPEAEVAERFKRDTADHQMIVLHDDGLYRHLRFTSNSRGYGAYWFDLITWPGVLQVRGDIGESYTFSRLLDMFEFFRSRNGEINAHYWSEKLDNGRESAKEYSEEAFRQRVTEAFVDAVRWSETPRGLGKAVREEILNSGCLAWESEARKVLEEFEFGVTFKATCSCGKTEAFPDEIDAIRWRSKHIEAGYRAHVSKVERVPGFQFSDTWEWNFHDYDRWFLWACHAIVSGIARYDRLASYGLSALAAPKAVTS
jgi:hypothetical protein